VYFRAGSLIKPFDSKRRSRLRQTISLRTPLGCLQSHFLQTSCEMKRLLFSGCDSIILLTVAISCLVTHRLRYILIPVFLPHLSRETYFFISVSLSTPDQTIYADSISPSLLPFSHREAAFPTPSHTHGSCQ